MTNFCPGTKLLRHIRNWLGLVALLVLPLARSQAQAPVLTGLSPAHNALAAPVAGNLTLSFSQSLDPATTANVRVWGNRRQGLRTGTRSGSNPLVFDPVQDFAPGEVVSVSVPATVQSTGGAAAVPVVYQFTAAAGQGPAVFAGGPNVPAGTQPQWLTAGDFDNDGDIDTVVPSHTGNPNANYLSINWGDGQGHFTAGNPILINAEVLHTATLDVDNDGDLDLLACSSLNVINIYLNDGAGGFTLAGSTALSNTPTVLSTGDIDADGDLDLLVSCSGELNVCRNNGAGTFTATAILPQTSNAVIPVLADLDNDGDLDLLQQNTHTLSVNWRRNTGTGTFGTATNVPVSVDASTLLAVDVDGDGDLDLVAADGSGGKYSLRRNNGSGAFSGVGTQFVSTDQPVDMAAGDVDGDGDLDLVIANGGNASLTVLRNGGTGTFTPDPVVGVGLAPKALALADVDGDGDLDLLAACAEANAVCVRLNSLRPAITGFSPADGGVGITVTITGTSLRDASSVSFGGVLPTSYVVNATGTQLTVTVPAGAVTGPITVTTPVGTAISATAFYVRVPLEVTAVGPARHTASAARSGNVAITFSQPVSAATASQLRVFGNQRGGQRTGSISGGGSAALTFDPAQDFAPGEELSVSVPATITTSTGVATAPHVYQFRAGASPVGPGTFGTLPDVDAIPRNGPIRVATADLDGDGDVDVLASNYGLAPEVGRTVSVFLNDGQGHLALRGTVSVGPYPERLATADVDVDGDLDLLVPNHGGSTVSVRLNNGAAVFAGGAEVPVGLHPTAVAAADVDGDGDLDLLSANYDANTVSVRLNAGSGSFGQGTEVPVGANPTDVAVGDVDNDGDLDLLTANLVGNTLSVRLNSGQGTFTGNTELMTGLAPVNLAVGDVDNDGDLDLLCANIIGQSASINLARNDGTGQFTVSGIPVSGDAYDIALADVDADNDLDLLSTSQNNNWVAVSLNGGTGTFTESSRTWVDRLPLGLATADFDGDGDLDFVTANYDGHTLSVRLNAPVPTVTGFAPASGAVGSRVVLTGTQLNAVLAVQLNSLSVTGFTVNPAGTELTLTVPAGASTGAFSLNAAYSQATTLALAPAVFAVLNPAPLTVTASTPINNERAAPRTANVALTFAQPVSAASAANVRVFGAQRGGRRTGTLSGAGTPVLAFDPTQDFAPGETVTVVVPASLQTASGSGTTKYVGQFTAAAGVGPGQFVACPDVPLLPNATIANNAVLYNIVTGDVNNDGKADLVMSTHFSGVELVRLGNGRGGFGAAPDVQAVAGPHGLALADLNNDGNLDLLVGNESGNSASVRLGTGTGTFTGVTNVPVVDAPLDGSGTLAVTAADVNGDGFLDVLTANNGGPTGAYVAVRLNTGNGTVFREAPNVPIVGGAHDIFTADLNGDGNLDLILRGSGTSIPADSRVNVSLGDGQGRFTPLPAVSTGAGSYHGVNSQGSSGSALGDVNGDGRPDIVLADAASANVKLLLGTSTGTFSAATNVPMGGIVRGIKLADIDGDGDLDLLAVDHAASVAYLRLNTGTGAFTAGGNIAVGLGAFTLLTPDLDNDGDLDLLVGLFAGDGSDCLTNVRLNQAPPTITSFTPDSGPTGTAVSVTGTEFLGTTAITFNGVPATSFVVESATLITVTVPVGATTGLLTVTTPAGTGTSRTPFTVTTSLPDLVVSTPQSVSGSYRNVTVTSTGVGTLTGPLSATGTVVVQTGGELNTACHPLTGSGSFTLEAGATLGICSAAGLSNAANTGAVQVTGPRSFSSDATYRYNGMAAQVTGNALPATVRELGLDNSTGLTLTQAVQVRQRVALTSGSLTLSGQPLTLLSSAAGTALVDNTGGRVLGPTGTMQRHIETNATANGYRHYSSPVQSETLATLATAEYAPNFSGAAAYNSSPTPGAVSPFPTMFWYNQDRIATSPSNYSAFDKGYEAITGGTAAMEVGRGYAVNAPGVALVDFTGTFTTGSVTRSSLNRTGVDGGWHLLGNPYPAPLDWSTLTQGAGHNLENLDGAVYVFQSAGPYAGTYRAFLAGAPGSSSPLVPAGSGFFVHTTTPGTPGTPGTVRLTNANRVTTFGAQPAFGRGATDTRPQLALTLSNAGSTLSDDAALYAVTGATTGVDAAYDAVKLASPTGLNLALLTQAGTALAIDGRPAFAVSTVVPLQLDAPATGVYTLRIVVANLPAGLGAYLRDAVTGQQVNLAVQPVTTVQLVAGRSTRFSVAFGQTALSTAPGLTAAQVLLYPNPAGPAAAVRVSLPVAIGTREVLAKVFNALGQQVGTSVLAVQNGEASGTLRTAGLAAGVYMVRLQAGPDVISQRLVVGN